MADNYYHGYVILSEQEYQQLVRDGTITKNGTTINYDENTTYATAEAEIEAGVAYTQSDSDIAQHITAGDVQDGTVVICNEKLTENEYQLGHLYKLSNATGTWAATDITAGGAGGSYTGSNGITISGDQIMLNENLFQAEYFDGNGIINIHTSQSGGRSSVEMNNSNTNMRVLGGNTTATQDNVRYQQGVQISSTGDVSAYRQKPLSDTENEYLFTDLIEPVVAGDNITVSRESGKFKISSTGGGVSYTATNGLSIDGSTIQLSPHHFTVTNSDTTEGSVEISSAFSGKGSNYKSLVQLQDGARVILKATQQDDGQDEIKGQLTLRPHTALLQVDNTTLDLINPIVAGDNVEVYHQGNQIRIDAKTSGGSYTGANGITVADNAIKLDEDKFTITSTMTSLSSQNVSETSATNSSIIANSDGTILISTNQDGSGVDLSLGTTAKITENNMGTTTSTNLINPVKAGTGIAIERDADQLSLSLSKTYRTPVTLRATGTYALGDLAQRISSEADLDYFRISIGLTPFTVTANVTTINSDGTITRSTETKSFEEFNYEAKSQYAHSAHFSVSAVEDIVELYLTAYNGVSSCMMFNGRYANSSASVFSVRFMGQEITQDGNTTKISTWDSGDIDLKSERFTVNYSVFGNTNR